MKTAMKSGDTVRLGVVRLLRSAIQNESIVARAATGSEEMSDDAVIAVLKREAKKRKESIVTYEAANRPDLADPEKVELEIIKEYLPVELSEVEVRAIVERIVAEGDKDFPSVMKKTIAEAKGAADGKMVAEIVKQLIG